MVFGFRRVRTSNVGESVVTGVLARSSGAARLMAAGALAAAMLFSACGKPGGGSSPTLRVVVREGLEAKGIRELATKWGEQRGIKVDVQTLGRETYEGTVTSDLLSARPRYDVVFFPGTLVAEFASRQALAPITGWSPGADPDLLAHSSYQGRVYGLPCDVSTFFMFYRSDVVAKPPETWQDLVTFAKQYAQTKPSDERPRYGLAFAGKAGEELPKIFYPILWSYGGAILEDGKVGLDAPAAIRAAKTFRELTTSGTMPPDLQSWEVGKIYDELRRGSVAISAPQWNALAPLIRTSDSKFRDVILIAPLPGIRGEDGQIRRVNFRQTWVLVKSSRTSQPQPANDFVLYATGKEGARVYALTAQGNPARLSVLSDPAIQRERPDFALLLASVKESKAEPDVPYYAAMHRAMNDALSSLIAGASTPESAMASAAAAVRSLAGSAK